MKAFHLFLLVGLSSPATLSACSSDASLGSDRSGVKTSTDPEDDSSDAADSGTPASGPTGSDSPSNGDGAGGEPSEPSSGPSEPSGPDTPIDPSEPLTFSAAECVAAGGEVTGDIGDGSIHRPDYVCPNGAPPSGTIQAAPGEPIFSEGAVCCGASPSERPTFTSAECSAAGGEVTGDIGDGSIHRPDYVCPNGAPPSGTIQAAPGEPIFSEGAVCCGASPSERPTFTSAECSAAGGEVTGDIGDGSIHRPDYVCANGAPPIGGIKPGKDEPIATEGAVCCGASPSERPTYTNAECKAASGVVTGDIGDGRIHRPDYVCENGAPPIGSIKPGEGEPIAIEGSVCCGAVENEPLSVSHAECTASGGEVTLDIGDGRIHRPGYLCPNGEPPIASINPAPGEPRPREGAVCCGAVTKRPVYTSVECVAAGGVEVFDIGDGRVHRPDYLCENGEPPIGEVRSGSGEPIAIEGSVCCGQSEPACSQVQCFRNIECVSSCGGPVLQSGCCACAEGTFDSIQCGLVEQLNTPCGEMDSCPPGLTPTKHFGVAGPQGPEFCACTIPCDTDPTVCPAASSCVTIADGPGTVCSG